MGSTAPLSFYHFENNFSLIELRSTLIECAGAVTKCSSVYLLLIHILTFLSVNIQEADFSYRKQTIRNNLSSTAAYLHCCDAIPLSIPSPTET